MSVRIVFSGSNNAEAWLDSGKEFRNGGVLATVMADRKNEKKRIALANVKYAQFERAALPAWRERKRGHRNRRSEQEREAEALNPSRWK